MKTVPEMLREAAKLYEERNALYGSNYQTFGNWFYPLVENIKVLNPHDTNRFGILFHIATKLSRYVENFNRGGHDDSLLDIGTYSAMLRELDSSFAGHEAVEPVKGHQLEVESDKGETLKVHIDDELYESLLAGKATLSIVPGQGIRINVITPEVKVEGTIESQEGPLRTETELLMASQGQRFEGNEAIEHPRCVCGHLKGIHRWGLSLGDDGAMSQSFDGSTHQECNDSACGCKKYAEATKAELGVSRG